MATSGDTTWTLTRDQIIYAALRKLGIVVDGGVVTANQLVGAEEALNNLIPSLYAQGMPLWAMRTIDLLMVQGQGVYPIGVGFGTGNANTPAPLKIMQAWTLDISGGVNNTYRLPLNIYTQYNFQLLNAPTTVGVPINLWYQPLNQTGNINIWPTPDNYSATNRQLWITYQRPFEDFDNSTDTPDFPQWWLEPLIYSLAHRLGPEYGIPLSERDKLNEEATALITNALSFGTEEGALFIQPDWVVMGMGQGNPNGY